jgi:hypothetical protein
MHVKEQVKEFVHDVKRRFSHKRKRETCSTFDSFDGASSNSGADTLSHLDDSSSCSSLSSLASTRERNRFIKFIRPRTSSITSKKNHPHNVLHKGRRADGKRNRLFSAPTVPSERMVEPNHKQASSYPGLPGSSQDAVSDSERAMLESLKEDYSDVLDISARGAVKTGSVTPTQTSSSSCGADRDSMSQAQPQFDTESQSDASGTLATSMIAKSVSESDSRFDSLGLYSDITSDHAPDTPHVSSTLIDPMADVPPVPPPKSDQAASPREEEITLAHSLTSPPTAAPPPPPTATPQPLTSTPASPPPVYLPRLTAPSMFLPIPNVRLIFPLSHSLLWWLAPKWSSGSRLPSSASILLPHSWNKSRFVSPHLRRSRSHPTPLSPLYSNYFLHPRTLLCGSSPRSRQ